MTAVHTPNTALLYSYLNLSPASSPSAQKEAADVAAAGEDVFSQAFKEHNTRAASNPTHLSDLSKLSSGAIERYLTPPRSGSLTTRPAAIENGSYFQGSSDASFEMFELPPLPTLDDTFAASPEEYEGGFLGALEFEKPLLASEPFITEPTMRDLSLERGQAGVGPSRGYPSHATTTTTSSTINTSLTPESQQLSASPAPSKPTNTRKRKPVDSAEREEKRKAFLERNRLAAGKCRKRKKQHTETLEERRVILERRNVALKDMATELALEVLKLRELVSLCERDHEIKGVPFEERTCESTKNVNEKEVEDVLKTRKDGEETDTRALKAKSVETEGGAE